MKKDLLWESGRFSAIMYTKDNFCDFVCFSAYQDPLKRAVYLEREELAPKVSKFFLFRVDPFQKEDKKNYIVASP